MTTAPALKYTEDDSVNDINAAITSTPRWLTNRALLEAGGSFAGAGFLAGIYFGLVGAVIASISAFALAILFIGLKNR
ncbi:MAG: hypothetical protein ACRD3J_23785 [Thermoanaerobaculia bacterium]